MLAKRVIQEYELDTVDDVLNIQYEILELFLDSQADIAPEERRRFYLLVRMFKLTNKKYNLGFQELRSELQLAVLEGVAEMEPVLAKLEDQNIEESARSDSGCPRPAQGNYSF